MKSMSCSVAGDVSSDAEPMRRWSEARIKGGGRTGQVGSSGNDRRASTAVTRDGYRRGAFFEGCTHHRETTLPSWRFFGIRQARVAGNVVNPRTGSGVQ